MISIHHLSKKYGTKSVLNDIDLHIETGKTIGIVGENGAGKSTLFRCIAGLEKYDGKIEPLPNSFKNRLGLLLAENYLIDRITGAEYLQLMTKSRGIEVLHLTAKNIFNLPLDTYIEHYSTGMKKKLALTGILLQKNNLFVLDEPFNGLDLHSNLILTAVLQELKRLNKTLLLSSHIFSTLKSTCDFIYVLENGRITKRVSPDQYDYLEQELTAKSLGNKVEQLGLE